MELMKKEPNNIEFDDIILNYPSVVNEYRKKERMYLVEEAIDIIKETVHGETTVFTESSLETDPVFSRNKMAWLFEAVDGMEKSGLITCAGCTDRRRQQMMHFSFKLRHFQGELFHLAAGIENHLPLCLLLQVGRVRIPNNANYYPRY